MKRTPLIVCLVAIIVLAGALVERSHRAARAAYWAELASYDTRDGKKEAEADIARGDLKWKVFGSGWSPEDAVRFKRLGVKLDHFHGSLVSDGILRYRYTYNSTVYSYLVKLVGKELTDEVLEGAPIDPSGKHREG